MRISIAFDPFLLSEFLTDVKINLYYLLTTFQMFKQQFLQLLKKRGGKLEIRHIALFSIFIYLHLLATQLQCSKVTLI